MINKRNRTKSKDKWEIPGIIPAPQPLPDLIEEYFE